MVETQESHLTKLFETVAHTDPLLPNYLENMRLEAEVFDSLRVQGRPDSHQYNEFRLARDNGTNNYHRFLKNAKPFILKPLTDDENFILMDKLSPHAQYELMVISASPDPISTIFEHTFNQRKRIFHLFSKFPQFAKNIHLFPYIAFSCDPDTLDRESGQSEKRFHAHFIGRTNNELSIIQNGKEQLTQLSPLRKRRFIDEFSIVASMILRDYLTHELDLRSIYLEPRKNESIPTLIFNLLNGWDTLTTIQFDRDFYALHNGLNFLYKGLMSEFASGNFGYWQRPNLEINGLIKTLNTYNWPSAESLEVLEYFLYKLKPQLLSRTDRFKKSLYRKITTHIYPLNGLCYSSAFFEEKNVPKMLIRPQLFSDLGGAGLEQIKGIATKIKRGVGTFTTEEMISRREFQNLFIREST